MRSETSQHIVDLDRIEEATEYIFVAQTAGDHPVDVQNAGEVIHFVLNDSGEPASRLNLEGLPRPIESLNANQALASYSGG